MAKRIYDRPCDPEYIFFGIGFCCSFAVFTCCAWPALWWGMEFETFKKIILAVWIVFSALTIALYVRRSAPSHAGESLQPGGFHWNRKLLFSYFLGAILLLGLKIYRPTQLLILAAGLIFSLLVLVWGWRQQAISTSTNESEEKDAPTSWKTFALAVVLLQVISAAVFVQESYDDIYYLAAVHDFATGSRLNIQEPTFREGFPVPKTHRTLCWELWCATLAHFSGVHPATLFHIILPGLVVLITYSAFCALFSLFLPRFWLPIGVLLLSALLISAAVLPDSLHEFVLNRPWMGKSALVNVAVPSVVYALVRFSRNLCVEKWLGFLLAILAGLGMSLTGIPLLITLVLLLTVVTLPFVCKRPIFLGGCFATLIPLVIAGLTVRSAITPKELDILVPMRNGINIFGTLEKANVHFGIREFAWFLLLPIQGWICPKSVRGYLILLPSVLIAFQLFPWVDKMVIQHMTSSGAENRLYWLLPVETGLVLVAFHCLAPWPRRRVLWAATACLLLVYPGMLLVRVVKGMGPVSLTGSPTIATNIVKIPDSYYSVANYLLADPAISDFRILCDERAVLHLNSYSRKFRFVQSRLQYAIHLFPLAGRNDEGLERGRISYALGKHKPWLVDNWADLSPRYRIKYVIAPKKNVLIEKSPFHQLTKAFETDDLVVFTPLVLWP